MSGLLCAPPLLASREGPRVRRLADGPHRVRKYEADHVTVFANRKKSLAHKAMLLKMLEPPSGEDPEFWMGYTKPFMDYYYRGEEGAARLAEQRQLAQDEARRQLEAEVETRVEAAPGKRGGVAGTKRSSTWDFVRILHEGKREDNKKVITVKCTIKTESGKECDWERKLVDGETGAMSKHFRSKGTDSVTCKACVNHKAAADICDESSCNGTGEVCAPEE